ncbi:hypothetical protein SLA2020_373220 [Shorea laevis]
MSSSNTVPTQQHLKKPEQARRKFWRGRSGSEGKDPTHGTRHRSSPSLPFPKIPLFSGIPRRKNRTEKQPSRK